jgi:hypothetical protein
MLKKFMEYHCVISISHSPYSKCVVCVDFHLQYPTHVMYWHEHECTWLELLVLHTMCLLLIHYDLDTTSINNFRSVISKIGTNLDFLRENRCILKCSHTGLPQEWSSFLGPNNASIMILMIISLLDRSKRACISNFVGSMALKRKWRNQCGSF